MRRERLDGRCLRMIEHDDAALVRRACGGDRGAFAALVERHYERIHRLGARALGNALSIVVPPIKPGAGSAQVGTRTH